MPQFINPAALLRPTAYSHVAVSRRARTVHVSGQVALDADGAIVGRGDLSAQTEQVFRNLAAALSAAGAGFADVLKATIFVVDLDPAKAAIVRAARARHFGDGPYPASSMVGVTALVLPELMIEIEVVAEAD